MPRRTRPADRPPPAKAATASIPSAATFRAEKLARRISHILALLHQGDVLDKQQLAQQFEVDVRTIERDLHERLADIIERNAEGKWQIKAELRSTIPANYLHEYSRLAGTARLFPDTSLPWLLKQLQTASAATRGLHVQAAPEEDLRGQSATFHQLQAAVQQRQSCRFTYKGKPRHAHPLRLTHQNGVWYLAAAELHAPTGEQQLKNFSVARIEALQVDENARFTPQPQHLALIEQMQDVWLNEKPQEATLRVAAEVAHYFTRRDLLPNQRTRADADGSLLIDTTIHHPQQLLPIARYWMPHMRILKPAQWQQMLIESVQQTLELWNQANPKENTGAKPEKPRRKTHSRKEQP